jgi:hypothetical protein
MHTSVELIEHSTVACHGSPSRGATKDMGERYSEDIPESLWWPEPVEEDAAIQLTSMRAALLKLETEMGRQQHVYVKREALAATLCQGGRMTMGSLERRRVALYQELTGFTDSPMKRVRLIWKDFPQRMLDALDNLVIRKPGGQFCVC